MSVIATPTQSLPRSRIIRRRAVFDNVRQKGRRLHSRCLTLSYLALEPRVADEAQVAFLTPKRLGKAHVRTRLRRQMREIFRRELSPMAPPCYLIWIARAPATELSCAELTQQMQNLYRRIGESRSR